jgi:hypothetical protein
MLLISALFLSFSVLMRSAAIRHESLRDAGFQGLLSSFVVAVQRCSKRMLRTSHTIVCSYCCCEEQGWGGQQKQ